MTSLDKQDLSFLFKSMFTYGILAVSFSLLGIFLPYRTDLENPLVSFDVTHIAGHITWGLVAGAASLSLRYFILAGSFAIIIDLDHLIQFFNIEAVARMSHSIPFAIISAVIMIILFGKKNYILYATAFAGMLAHVSFDTFTGGGNFPLFAPFYSDLLQLQTADWIFFQLAAVFIIGLAAIQTKRLSLKRHQIRN